MNKKISTFFNVWDRSNESKLGQKMLFLPHNVFSMSLELVIDKHRTFWQNSMNTFYNPNKSENFFVCSFFFVSIFSRVLRDSTPRFVGLSVRPSLFLFFGGFCYLWPHCSCPNDEVTSNMAPAHPHATGAAVYPALLHLRPLVDHLTLDFWLI